MSDLISRLSELRCQYNCFDEHERDAYHTLSEAIKAISAQRTGRWIIKENPETKWYRVTCSACGEDVTSVIPLIGFFPNVKALWDFCPECGARMEEQECET